MMRPPILKLPRNIVLVGFMGAGKTTVGRALADRLRWPFVDTDHRIVADAEGRSIPTIFSAEGDERFRERETEAVKAVCGHSGQVIATGGGTVVRPDNVTALSAAGMIVWLTARPEVVVARTKRTARARPLLAEAARGENVDETALLARVLCLLSERAPYYHAAADLIVDTSDDTPTALAATIHRKAERWKPDQRELICR